MGDSSRQVHASAQREMSWDVVSPAAAKKMVLKWHYSHRMPRGRNICYGWWSDGNLYAVAVFGNGVNPYQASFLTNTTGFDVTNENHVELKRLARVEPRLEGVQLTQFIRLCCEDLKLDGYRYVVAFSDPEEGHQGTIYKAANFTHLGRTQAEWHVLDKDGMKRHRRVAYRHAKKHNMTIDEARKVLGFTPVQTLPRDRWFWAIYRPDRQRYHKRNSTKVESSDATS